MAGGRASGLDWAAVAQKFTRFEVKPAVGFTLPWAGVTPAPSVKKMRGQFGTFALFDTLCFRRLFLRASFACLWLATSSPRSARVLVLCTAPDRSGREVRHAIC